ncbi:MAG TPA: hypothetical protein VOA87_13020 [Thermoanaerobaculia bacterium]|nr:hypothetical protein [Thermoanaerobaculia bacterium]
MRPSPIARTLTAGLALAAALAAGPAASRLTAQTAPANGDAEADRIAGQVMDALGGRAAWDATHYIHFTFAGRRTHTWDKWTGRHRVEGKTRDGESFVVLENLNTHEGQAWVNGKPAAGDQLKKFLELGYGTWVNDTYWLLMPYKMKDPGVHLAFSGEETLDGKPYDKLELTFDHVGLTPGDHYTAYINRETHLMDRWRYVLEGMKPEDKPGVWKWEGWQRYGKILLAPHRVEVGGDGKLELSDIAVSDALPDAVFTSPAAVK